MESTAPTIAEDMVTGLRRFADLIEANPDLAEQMCYVLDDINVPVDFTGKPRDVLAAFARAGARAGIEVRKDYASSTWSHLHLPFSKYVGIDVYASRDKVCEKVVTGTSEVTKTVPDPTLLAAVPTVEVTEVVETFRWECRPLLAERETAELDAETRFALTELAGGA